MTIFRDALVSWKDKSFPKLNSSMFPAAYMFITSELGGEKQLISDLQAVEGVTEVYGLYGVYNVAAHIVVNDMDKLKEICSRKIRSLKNVRSTMTMLQVDEGYKRPI